MIRSVRNMAAVILACGAVLVSCSQADTDAAIEAELRERFQSGYIAPYVAADVDAWMTVFADDATALHNGLPPLVGRDAIRGFADAVAKNFEIVTMDAVVEEVRKEGDWAWTRGRFTAEFKAKTEDAPPGVEGVRHGKFLLIWEKQPDGNWLVISDMGNESPPPSPTVVADGSLYYPCQSCHGEDGSGSEALGAPTIAGMDAEYLARQMRHFRDGVRGGSLEDLPGRQMSLVAAVYQDNDQIDQLAAYVESMPETPIRHVGGYAETDAADEYRVCAVCHGADGSGGASPGAPALNRLEDWYLASQLKKYRAGIRGADEADSLGQQMRLASAQLTDRQISQLTAHIAMLSANGD